MSEIIHGQVTFLIVTLCCGMALVFGYEILRLLRWMFWHPGILTWIEDILYWAAASVPVYYIFFVYNNGEIRWYGALMLVTGAGLYEKGISMPVRRGLVKVFGSHKPSLVRCIKKKRQKKKQNKVNKDNKN